MKRKWNWPIWVGFVVAVGGLFSYEYFRAVSDHARFSVGESFALWHRCRAAARWFVSSVWTTATLSRQSFWLDFRRDCVAFIRLSSVTKSSTFCGRFRFPRKRRAVGEKAPEFSLPDQNGKQVALCRFAFAQRRGLDFLSRLLVTTL